MDDMLLVKPAISKTSKPRVAVQASPISGKTSSPQGKVGYAASQDNNLGRHPLRNS